MAAPPTIDDDLAEVGRPDQRDALPFLRALIRTILPNAIDGISAGMPAHRMPERRGKVVIGYAACARHCGRHRHSGRLIPQIAAEHPARSPSKTGLLFTAAQPLQDAQVRRIISPRLARVPTHGH